MAEKKLCSFCGKPNKYKDEEGYFYLQTEPDMEFGDGQPACKACVNGEPGRKHDALHGKGDR